MDLLKACIGVPTTDFHDQAISADISDKEGEEGVGEGHSTLKILTIAYLTFCLFLLIDTY